MKPRALLELARVSNLPTVWSNVMMGLAWSLSVTVQTSAAPFALLRSHLTLFIGASLMYIAGMMLNDASDAEVDAKERPSRPIPSGRISRQTAWRLGFAALVVGLGLVILRCDVNAGSIAFTFANGWVILGGALLATLIVLYNAIHQRWAGAVMLMAACRGILVFTAVVSLLSADQGLAIPAWALVLLLPVGVLFAYTLILSGVARHEVEAGRAWVVGGLIVAMPLVDAAMLACVSQWSAMCFCLTCAGLTWAGQRWVAGS